MSLAQHPLRDLVDISVSYSVKVTINLKYVSFLPSENWYEEKTKKGFTKTELNIISLMSEKNTSRANVGSSLLNRLHKHNRNKKTNIQSINWMFYMNISGTYE